MLFGKSQKKKTALSNFITKKRNFPVKTFTQSTVTQGEWRRKPLRVVRTSGVFSQPVEKVRHEMKKCVALCPPGPNVLLLLVKPSDFSEEDRQTLKFILSFFGGKACKYSVVILTHNDDGENSTVDRIIQDCGHRKHKMNFDKNLSESDLQALMETMEKIVSDNRGGHLNYTEEADPVEAIECAKPPLNLVLWEIWSH